MGVASILVLAGAFTLLLVGLRLVRIARNIDRVELVFEVSSLKVFDMCLQALDCFFLVSCLAQMTRLLLSLKELDLLLQSSDLVVVLVS